jgi:glycosyltransferase involved in cell wall biosynthesis
LATPVARVLGLRIVFTHHGRDYDREKWGPFAKWILRAGEYMGVRFSHECIAISKTIQGDVHERLDREPSIIRNGVLMPEIPDQQENLRRFGLVAGRYILMVARFVPEKRQLDLIRAFQDAAIAGWRLALVGDLEDGGTYAEKVQDAVADNPEIVLTGFQRGVTLHELYGYAGLFVLPSSHEGLPIALLEALSYGVPVLASDISANKEVGLEEGQYFPVGSVEALKERLRALTGETVSVEARVRGRERIAREYNWLDIGRETEGVYLSAIGHKRSNSPSGPNSSSNGM